MEYMDWVEIYSYLSVAKEEYKRMADITEEKEGGPFNKEIKKIESLQKKVLEKIGEKFNAQRQ